MDEAHRYRASSGAAMKAIADLDPVIGLELTATPMSTGAKPKRFKNVIYDYSLAARWPTATSRSRLLRPARTSTRRK